VKKGIHPEYRPVVFRDASADFTILSRSTIETERTIDVRVDGRAQVVDDLDHPTATITVPTLLWFRWAAGRRPADPAQARIEGVEDLARRVLANAAYTI